MNTTDSHESNHVQPDGADAGLRSQLDLVARELADSAEVLARRSANAMRQRGALLQEASATLVRERPLRSVLVSACAGAMLVIVAGWLRRSRNPKGLS